MPLKGSQLVLLVMLVPAEVLLSPCSTPPIPGSLLSTVKDGRRDEGDSSTNEMDRISNPGLLVASSAGPMLAPEETVTVAAMAAAAAAATSEPLLCGLWPLLLWEAPAPVLPHFSSASGASSNRRLNLCEKPDGSGKDDA